MGIHETRSATVSDRFDSRARSRSMKPRLPQNWSVKRIECIDMCDGENSVRCIYHGISSQDFEHAHRSHRTCFAASTTRFADAHRSHRTCFAASTTRFAALIEAAPHIGLGTSSAPNLSIAPARTILVQGQQLSPSIKNGRLEKVLRSSVPASKLQSQTHTNTDVDSRAAEGAGKTVNTMVEKALPVLVVQLI